MTGRRGDQQVYKVLGEVAWGAAALCCELTSGKGGRKERLFGCWGVKEGARTSAGR